MQVYSPVMSIGGVVDIVMRTIWNRNILSIINWHYFIALFKNLMRIQRREHTEIDSQRVSRLLLVESYTNQFQHFLCKLLFSL